MPLPVSLDAAAEELSSLMDDAAAYVNRKTGDLATVSADEVSLAEDDVRDDELPDGESEEVARIREILWSEDWRKLPTKFEIHEWTILQKFAAACEDEALRERLQNAIHGRGAFRAFRDIVEHAGLREEWFRFRHEALREIAKAALERAGIPWR